MQQNLDTARAAHRRKEGSMGLLNNFSFSQDLPVRALTGQHCQMCSCIGQQSHAIHSQQTLFKLMDSVLIWVPWKACCWGLITCCFLGFVFWGFFGFFFFFLIYMENTLCNRAELSSSAEDLNRSSVWHVVNWFGLLCTVMHTTTMRFNIIYQDY